VLMEEKGDPDAVSAGIFHLCIADGRGMAG
jgi:hypothetical protein